MNTYGENICGAIELLVENAIRGLQYDKSISCTITDASNSNLGEYQVSDGSSTFIAYGDKRAYKVNDEVYVLIPQGDYNQEKRITFKKTKTEESKTSYEYAIDSVIPLEKITIENDGNAKLIANHPDRNKARKVIYQNPKGNIQGVFFKDNIQYTTMGLETSIITSFKENVIEGTYEIFVRLIGELDTGENTEKIYVLDSSQFFGNPYRFSLIDQEGTEGSEIEVIDESANDEISEDEGILQSIIFDISDFARINKISVEIQERDNFYYLNEKGEKIKISYTDEEKANPSEIKENIIEFKNTSLVFGYNINQYSDNDLALYTTSSLDYLNNAPVEKTVKLNWIKKLNDNTTIPISSIVERIDNNFQILKPTNLEENLVDKFPYLTDLFKQGLVSIYWYRYLLGDYPQDPILNKPMQMMSAYYNNKHYIIEKPENSTEDIFVYDKAKALESNYFDFSFKTDPNFIKEEATAAIVFNGCLMEKIIKINETGDGYITPNEGEYEWDKTYYNPLIEIDLNGEGGVKKSFIEKCKEMFPNSARPDIDISYAYSIVNNDKTENLIKYIPRSNYKVDENGNPIEIEEDGVKYYIDTNDNLVRIDTLEEENQINFAEVNTITFYDIRLEPDLIIAELKYIEDAEEFTPVILTSNSVEFLNSASAEEIKLNLIQEVALECKDDYNGTYFIYDNTLKKIQSNMSNKERVLEVSYKSFISDLIKTEKTTVQWRIPANNSMIAPPENKEDEIQWTLVKIGNETFYESNLIEIQESPNQENSEGSTTTGKHSISYKLQEYYSSNINNNIITCTIKKGDTVSTISKELRFGTIGTNGTQYTLSLSLGKKYTFNETGEGNNITYEPQEVSGSSNQPFLSYSLQKGKEWVEVVPTLKDNIKDEIIDLNEINLNWDWRVTPKFKVTHKDTEIEITKEEDGNTITSIEKKDQEVTYNSLNFREINVNDTFSRYFVQLPPKEIEGNVISNIKSGLNVNTLNQEKYQHETVSVSRYCAILKLSLNYNNIDLTSYLPIPAAFSKFVQGYAGPESIVYDSQGSNPQFKKIPELFYNPDLLTVEKVGTLDWWVGIVNEACYSATEQKLVSNYANLTNETIFKQRYPYFSIKNNTNTLTCSNFYYKDILEDEEQTEDQIPISIHAVIKNASDGSFDSVYSQPLLILQDAFGSSFLNEWNGEYYEDIENGIIMSNVLGAGTKTKDNKFTGVLLGEVKDKIDGAVAKTGLYGYQKGAQVFSFNEDGKAFLGASGNGRIYFDGSNGIIESGGFTEDNNNIWNCAGSQWDLKNSAFKLYGTKNATAKFIIDTSATGKNPSFALYGSYQKIDEQNNKKTIWFPALHYGENNFYMQSYPMLDNKESFKDMYRILTSSSFENSSVDGVVGNLELDFNNGSLIADKGLIGGWAIQIEKLIGGIQYINSTNKTYKSTIELINGDINSAKNLSQIVVEFSEKSRPILSPTVFDESSFSVSDIVTTQYLINFKDTKFLENFPVDTDSLSFKMGQNDTISKIGQEKECIINETIGETTTEIKGKVKGDVEFIFPNEDDLSVSKKEITFQIIMNLSNIDLTAFEDETSTTAVLSLEPEQNEIIKQTPSISNDNLPEEVLMYNNSVQVVAEDDDEESAENDGSGGTSGDMDDTVQDSEGGGIVNDPSNDSSEVEPNVSRKIKALECFCKKIIAENFSSNNKFFVDCSIELNYSYTSKTDAQNDLVEKLINNAQLFSNGQKASLKEKIGERIEAQEEIKKSTEKRSINSILTNNFINGNTEFESTKQGLEIHRDGTLKLKTGYIYEYRDSVENTFGLNKDSIQEGVIEVKFNKPSNNYSSNDHIILRSIFEGNTKYFDLYQTANSVNIRLSGTGNSSKQGTFSFVNSNNTQSSFIIQGHGRSKSVAIYFKPTNSKGNYSTIDGAKIEAYDDGDEKAYGTNMLIQGGGHLFLGGGESAHYFYQKYKNGLYDKINKVGERLYLLSDSSMQFYVNCNSLKDGKTKDKLALQIYDSGTSRFYGAVLPSGTEKCILGSKDYPWKQLYLQQSSGSKAGIYFALDGDYEFFRPLHKDNNCMLGSPNRRWRHTYTRFLTVSTPFTKTTEGGKKDKEAGGVVSHLIPSTNGNIKLGDKDYKWYSIYTKNFHIYGKESSDTKYQISAGFSKGTDKTINTEDDFTFLRPYSTEKNRCYLGTSKHRWHHTYTSGLTVSNPDTTDTYGGSGGVASSLIPSADNEYNLGSPTYRWDVGYLTRLNLYPYGVENEWHIEMGLVSNDNPSDRYSYIRPYKETNQCCLGTNKRRWHSIYGKNFNGQNVLSDGGGIQSDGRVKDIQSMNILEQDLQIYDKLKPTVYKYKNIFNTDNYSRTHIGFIAQEVENLIQQNGLNNENCALVQTMNICDEPEVSQEEKDFYSDGKKYYLNYNELHGLHVLKNQRQDQEIKELKEKIKILESRIKYLESNS